VRSDERAHTQEMKREFSQFTQNFTHACAGESLGDCTPEQEVFKISV
jgi:hypothetical protein